MQAAFLFELAIKATLVIVATWAFVRLLSGASAAARSAAWASGLAFIVALPLCMAIAPSWSLDTLRVSLVGRAIGAFVADLGIDEALERREQLRSSPAASTVREPDPRALPDAASAAAIVWAGLSILWLLGTVVALVRLGRGFLSVGRMGRAAAPLVDPELSAIVARACAHLGLRRAPSIRTSSDLAVPAVFGLWNPTLLLPSDYHQWSEPCRRVVVLHELAHIQRRDCLIQFVADCASAMYWFHPLVRTAAARVRHEREEACDDVVIAAGTSPTAYADHLLDLVRAGLAVPPAPAVAFGTPSRLNQRISALLDDERCRTAPAGRTVIAAVLAGVVAVATLGGARVMAQAALHGPVFDHGGGVVTRLITADTRQRVKDELTAALRDGDRKVRSVASAAVEAIMTSGSAPLRVETPCGGNCVNWDNVADALEKAMQGLRDELAVLQLASDDVEVRRAAVGRVWPRTQRGAAALTRALLDDDRIVRNGAAIRLDSVHAPIAVPNWIVLLGDSDPMLRERAAISLGVIGDPRAIDPLADALRDPEAPVRLQAATALASIALGREGINAAMAGSVLQARTVYRKEDGVTLPELVREVRPVYTPAAMQARIQGGVVMRAVVEADGSVKDVEVVESLDTEHGLDEQATQALKQCEFKPGLWMGAAVPVLITFETRFTLK
jgi:TonB family protein